MKKTIEDDLKLRSRRAEATEIQRRLMQGEGKPIISAEQDGHRYVAVGERILSSKTWRTFTDFLKDYISGLLGAEWGNEEISKPEQERHPLIKWYQNMCLHQQKYIKERGVVVSMPINGSMRGYLGLAYDLYLIEHNIKFPKKLINRLKSVDQFEGALYEAYVTGRFAKAGFRIEPENEDDPNSSHCEFVATHELTGRKFAVEAKAVSTESSRAGKSAKPVAIRSKLHDALKKRADFPRIIFVEVSRAEGGAEARDSTWLKRMVDDVSEAEKTLTIEGQPAPSAYLFITNRPFVYNLDETDVGGFYSATGFKIDDFPFEREAKTILDMHKLRKKHLEPYALLKAFDAHWDIPQTFDERTPAEVFGKLDEGRLLIGNSYLVPDSSGKIMPAKLINAVVMESDKSASCIYRFHDGSSTIICNTPLNETEMEMYRQSPKTFFGETSIDGGRAEHPLDLFDFFLEACSQTSRETLLSWMAASSDEKRLRELSRDELAEEYCASLATQSWARSHN